MTAVELVRSQRLSDVAEYAYAASVPADTRLIFLAGSCPLDEDGATVAVGDYAGQAAQALANLRTALEDAGASITDVVSTRVLRSEEHTSELQSRGHLVCRLLLEKKNNQKRNKKHSHS